MHELSLVQSLIHELEELVAKHNATGISSVHLSIGPMAGVVIDSFAFGFEVFSSEHKWLKGCKLIVETPPTPYKCLDCGWESKPVVKKPDICPCCQQNCFLAMGGTEMLLTKVDLELI